MNAEAGEKRKPKDHGFLPEGVDRDGEKGFGSYLQRVLPGQDQGDPVHPGDRSGLAIAKRIVEAHNGQIEVESKPQKGSTFRVLLPI